MKPYSPKPYSARFRFSEIMLAPLISVVWHPVRPVIFGHGVGGPDPHLGALELVRLPGGSIPPLELTARSPSTPPKLRLWSESPPPPPFRHLAIGHEIITCYILKDYRINRVAQEPNRNRKPEPSEPFSQEPKAEPEPPEPFSRNPSCQIILKHRKALLQRNRRNRKPEPLEPFHPETTRTGASLQLGTKLLRVIQKKITELIPKQFRLGNVSTQITEFHSQRNSVRDAVVLCSHFLPSPSNSRNNSVRQSQNRKYRN